MEPKTTVLYPPLAESQVIAFEYEHGIDLPAEYRAFILGSGNGGDSFFRLGEVDDGWGFSRWKGGDGFVGILAKPFPYIEPWNDLAGYVESTPDESEDEQRKYEQMRETFDERYYQAIDGALPLAHLGCAIRLWLVVTGTERGYVWYDDRANLAGMRPLLSREGNRLGFLSWYRSEANDG